MTDTINKLARARQEAEQTSGKRKAMLEAFKNFPEYVEATYSETQTAELVERLENTLRAEALGQYAADNNKNGNGYKIKTETVVSIPDTQAAVHWCKDNFTPALKLNEAVLKTAAKNGTVPVEIATVIEQPKVYIDADLSKYLGA